MSSLWKDDRTPYHVACLTVFEGNRPVQLKKTTGTADRELAKQIAIKLEQAGRGQLAACDAQLFLEEDIGDLQTRRVVRRAFDDVLRRSTGHGLGGKTTREFIEAWLERTRNEVSPGTWTKYKQITELFLASLAGKADVEFAEITQADIAYFRDVPAKRVAVGTVNVALKIVRIIFGSAEADGLVQRNEAKHVKTLKDRREKSARRPFTLKELKKVLKVCNEEWRSLVLFGFYTGARLSDLALLTWKNVDLTGKELSYASRKTARRVGIPLATPLLEHLERLPAGDNPSQPLHPKAFEIINREGRTGTLSRQFMEILAAAGLVPARSHQAEDGKRKGRSARRETSEISFHCLRHTAVSLLKNAGVSDAVAQDLVGHDSAAVSRVYTHIEDKAKRDAVNKLPVL